MKKILTLCLSVLIAVSALAGIPTDAKKVALASQKQPLKVELGTAQKTQKASKVKLTDERKAQMAKAKAANSRQISKTANRVAAGTETIAFGEVVATATSATVKVTPSCDANYYVVAIDDDTYNSIGEEYESVAEYVAEYAVDDYYYAMIFYLFGFISEEPVIEDYLYSGEQTIELQLVPDTEYHLAAIYIDMEYDEDEYDVSYEYSDYVAETTFKTEALVPSENVITIDIDGDKLTVTTTNDDTYALLLISKNNLDEAMEEDGYENTKEFLEWFVNYNWGYADLFVFSGDQELSVEEYIQLLFDGEGTYYAFAVPVQGGYINGDVVEKEFEFAVPDSENVITVAIEDGNIVIGTTNDDQYAVILAHKETLDASLEEYGYTKEEYIEEFISYNWDYADLFVFSGDQSIVINDYMELFFEEEGTYYLWVVPVKLSVVNGEVIEKEFEFVAPDPTIYNWDMTLGEIAYYGLTEEGDYNYEATLYSGIDESGEDIIYPAVRIDLYNNLDNSAVGSYNTDDYTLYDYYSWVAFDEDNYYYIAEGTADVEFVGVKEGYLNYNFDITLVVDNVAKDIVKINSTVLCVAYDPYTSELVDLENNTAISNITIDGSVWAESGRIYAGSAMRIYDLLGRDVTAQNGSLSGLYIVTTQAGVAKVQVSK